MSSTQTMEQQAERANGSTADAFDNAVSQAVGATVQYKSPGYQPVLPEDVEKGRYYGYDPNGPGVDAFSGV